MLTGMLTVLLLAGCSDAKAPQEDSTTPPATEETNDQVAGAGEMTTVDDVTWEGMHTLHAKDIKDGTYQINVDSSSKMFHIISCELTVDGEDMTAVMTMSGKGYTKIFMGTGEEASAASEDAYIPFVEDADGNHTYTVPVNALDEGLSCTAFSKNKEKWYDRTLVFRADSLPLDALEDGIVKMPEDLHLSDGEYTVNVVLQGGSGRASVTSPAKLEVTLDECVATIEWSSNHYDYMKIEDTIYEPITLDPVSTFALPVTVFDWPIPVIADTTAMSEPHEIEYTLTFDAASVQPAS